MYTRSSGSMLPVPSQPRLNQSGGWTSTHNQSRQHTTTSSQALGQTVQSERILSSNIVGETMLGPMPLEENIQYVEIPVIEEVIKHVPRKEYVEVEKRVPKYEYEWVERIVEVPQIHIVDKTVDVPQIQEVIRHVAVKQVIEVPKEIIRRVPKIETKVVEREVEVPGEIIEVPKPYLVENKVVVPRYTNKEVPTVVAQRLIPVISESETDFVDVDLKEYNPYLVPVDVYVPRPVARQLIAASKIEEHHVVDVPVGQFNSLLKQLNTHVQESEFQELLVKDHRGAIPIIPLTSGSIIVSPVNDEWEVEHAKGTLHYSHNAPLGNIGVGSSAAVTSYATTTPKYLSTRGPVIASQSYANVQPNSYISQSYTSSIPYSQPYVVSGGYSTGQTCGTYGTTSYVPMTTSLQVNDFVKTSDPFATSISA